MKNITNIALALWSASHFLTAADFDIRNEAEFKKCLAENAKVEKLAGGFKFVEGPAWVPQDGGFLVFSDIPANELKRWDAKNGVTVFRRPSNHANGNTRDAEGRLLTCEHSGRRISIWEKDGTINPLIEKHEGRRFNSPNDAVVKSDGTIWFTDPDYGLGNKPKEQAGNFVYRYDPSNEKLTLLVKDFDKPNGLCFSPDEKKLYVADSGKPRHIRVFEVNDDGTVATGKVFCEIDYGGPDGIRCDKEGRIWSSAGDGVHIFAPDGALIGKIFTPETPANLTFGVKEGAEGKALYITARTSLYRIETLVKFGK